MTLFTTLQSLVPQQKISEIAGRLAQSRHPMVKKPLFVPLLRCMASS